VKMDMKINDEMIDRITAKIYQAYGSGTGVLFGFPAYQRISVRAVVKATLMFIEEK